MTAYAYRTDLERVATDRLNSAKSPRVQRRRFTGEPGIHRLADAELGQAAIELIEPKR